MTRLRKMMLEELQRRNYSAITTRNYLRVVADFAKHFGKSPDKLGLNELRTYQAYLLRERKLTPGTVVNQVAALRFFFVKTLKRHQFRDFLAYPQDQRRHLLRLFLTSPSAAAPGGAPARRCIRVFALSKQPSLQLSNRLASDSCEYGGSTFTAVCRSPIPELHPRLAFKSHSAPPPPQTPAASS